VSGFSGFTGISGYSGTSGFSGTGLSGFSGQAGTAITGLVATSTAQLDKTNDTGLATITGLSLTLQAGTTYPFEIILLTTAGAAGGVKVDLNGGTATATTLNWNATFSTATTIANSTDATALATTAGSTAAVLRIVIAGTITVNAGGTFAPRFAQNVSNGTTSSVFVGSFMTTTGGASLFGNDAQYASTDALLSTSVVGNNDRVTLTTGALNGTYWVEYGVTAGQTATNKVTTISFLNTTDTVTMDSVSVVANGSTGSAACSNFFEVTFTGAAKTFVVRGNNPSGGTMTMQNARIRIWKKS
jgi:hypothetical protein